MDYGSGGAGAGGTPARRPRGRPRSERARQAILAAAGNEVVGLDPDEDVVRGLRDGRPPLEEPGLAERIAACLAAGRLTFTTDAGSALRSAGVTAIDRSPDQYGIRRSSTCGNSSQGASSKIFAPGRASGRTGRRRTRRQRRRFRL